MKQLTIIFWLFAVSLVQGQSLSDSILIEEALNGYNFFYHNLPIQANEVSQLLEELNYDAFDEFESAREASVFGNVFCVIGTTLIVIPFVTSALGKDTNWALTIAGTGFVGISIPIFKAYNKKTHNAIQMYNLGIQPKGTSLIQPEFGFGLTRSGVGLCLNF
jgi:hypothetical protein